VSRAPASTCARVDDDAVRETGGKETFASVRANGARVDVDRVATARGSGGVSVIFWSTPFAFGWRKRKLTNHEQRGAGTPDGTFSREEQTETGLMSRALMMILQDSRRGGWDSIEHIDWW
jgi:hypothetical protein